MATEKEKEKDTSLFTGSPGQQANPATAGTQSAEAVTFSDDSPPTDTVAASAEELKLIEKEANEALALPQAAQQRSVATTGGQAWDTFELDIRFAKAFATSGLFGLRGKGKQSIPIGQAIAAAFVRIQVGKSLGFDAAQSMMGISIVNDKPVVEYAILAARCRALGYDWDTHFTYDKASGRCTGCRLYLKKNGQPVLQPKRDEQGNPVLKTRDGKLVLDENGDPVYEQEQVSKAFTEADAKRITQETTKWVNNVPTKIKVSLFEKDTYQNYGENMYFARAFHNLQRFHMSEAINAPVSLAEAGEHLDTIDSYESAPGVYTPYQQDAARQQSGQALRDLQQQQNSGETPDQVAAASSQPAPAKSNGGGFGKRN